jgi:hypothetical protein
MKHAFLGGGLVVCLLGCNEKGSVSAKGRVVQRIEVPPSLAPPLEPVVPRPSLQIMPDDLMTGVRGMPPTLLVSGALDTQETAQVVRSLRLVTWPSRRFVETHVQVEPRDEAAGRIVHRFLVVPTKPLDAGWYAGVVDLAALPARLAAGADVQASPWPGHLVSRFAPHRTTIVSDLRTDPVGSETRLTLRFSARVQDPRPAESLVRVTAGLGSAPCIAENDASLHGADGTYEVKVLCREASFPLRVKIESGLRSLDGVLLAQAYGGHVEFDVPEDPAVRRVTLARALGLDGDGTR